MSDARLLTPGEIAADLRLQPNTLAKWRVADEGPTYLKIGGAVRYPEDEYLEWKARCRVVPSKPTPSVAEDAS